MTLTATRSCSFELISNPQEWLKKRARITEILSKNSLFAIDFEWIPDEKSRNSNEISMIQIAYQGKTPAEVLVILIRVCNFASVPLVLIEFLLDPTRVKLICSEISPNSADFRKLALWGLPFDQTSRSFISIQQLAKEKGLHGISMKKMCEFFNLPYFDVDFQIHKLWAHDWTPDEHLHTLMTTYAADDAALTLKIYKRLLKMCRKFATPSYAYATGRGKKNDKSVYPCNQLTKTGKCDRPQCEYSHSVLKCDLCNVLCTSQDGYLKHMNGYKHREAVKAEGKAPRVTAYCCSPCSKYFASQAALAFHHSSREHQKIQNAIRFGAAKDLAQSDKEGICFDSEVTIDFKVLDVGASLGVQFKVENNANTSLRFVKADFKVSDTAFLTATIEPTVIAPRATAVAKVGLKAKMLGYFQTEMEFQFTRDGSSTLSISRTVIAFIGDQALYNELKPMKPYTKRKTHASFIERGYIAADKEESSGEVTPFIKRLGYYDLPPKIKEVVFASSAGKSMPTHKEFAHTFFQPSIQSTSYKAFHSSLLWAEEAQMQVDILQYSLFGVHMEATTSRNGGYLLLVPGLAENRPSVLKGDAVYVKLHSSNQRPFEGRAVDVTEKAVMLRFSRDFDKRYLKGQQFDVQFKYNRIPWRRMQHAVEQQNVMSGWDEVYRSNVAEVKTKDRGRLEKVDSDPPAWLPFNKMIAENPEQKRAVSIIVSGVHRPMPFLLFGPPGTGKTVTLVESIKQIASETKTKILVCAPSNSAADLLLERLSTTLKPMEMFRLNAFVRGQPSTFKNFDSYSLRSRSANMNYDVHPLDKMKRFKVIVSTCSSAAVLESIGLERGFFTHVFIDESGQALEAEAMIPIANFYTPDVSFVLAGDHMQLGPIIHSSVAKKLGFGVSLLERLMGYCSFGKPTYDPSVFKVHNPRKGRSDMMLYASGVDLYSTKLLRNYRSHPDILEIPNEMFYKGELEPFADQMISKQYLGWPDLTNPKCPMLFVHVVGKDEREGDSPSFYNIAEIQAVNNVVSSLQQGGKGFQTVRGPDIGVISPYNRQCDNLRKKLGPMGVTVGTVETFQGQERNVIIISTVRSNPEYMAHDKKFNLGFLGDPKRFNVAVTRAKSLLVLIGNGEILCQDISWQKWIRNCYEKNAVKNMTAGLKEAILRELKEKVVDEDAEVDSDEEELVQTEAGWREME